MKGRRLMIAGVLGACVAILADLAWAANQGGADAPQAAATAVTPERTPPSNKAAPADKVSPPGASGGRIASTVGVKREGERVLLRIKGASALAVFQRAGALWLAWDAPSNLNVAAMERAAKGLVGTMQPISAASASVLRIAAGPEVAARIDRASDVWTVELTREDRPPAHAIAILPLPAKDGSGTVVLHSPGLRHVLTVRDPEAGDQILIIPSTESGLGIAAERAYAQFSILPSWQGAAIVPAADHVVARPVEDGIEVVAEGGLVLSRPGDVERSPAVNADTKLFAFDAWRALAPGTFVEGSQALMAAAAFAAPADRNKARLALAQYKFAHGFPREALAILEVIGREDPAFGDRPDVIMLRGACRLSVGDIERAQRDLGASSLGGVGEARLWRAVLVARSGDLAVALQDFAQGMSFLTDYPSPYRQRLGLAAAEAALSQNAIDQAERFLEIVSRQPLTETDRNHASVVRGRILQLAGQDAGALALWNEVRKSRDPRNVVRATLASVELGVAKGKVTKDKAIQDLESARYSWRGDDLEFQVLKMLGRLYLDTGEYRKGLEMLRTAAIHFPGHKDAGAVTREMSEAFAELFRDGAFERMPIVAAIALYNDFGELTPAGAAGEPVMAKLIERLAALDLLDQASVLLERQLGNLPAGEGRARIATQLAELRLNDQKPQAALDALEASDAPDVPPELRLRRTILHAKALAALGRTDAAVATLHDDLGIDAIRLRADIIWRSGQWAAAAQAYRSVLAYIKPVEGKLDEAEAEAILKGAIAFAFTQDIGALDQLRAQYGASMAKGPHDHAFEVVTSHPTKAELRGILGELGDVKAFKGLLAAGNTPPRQGKAGP